MSADPFTRLVGGLCWDCGVRLAGEPDRDVQTCPACAKEFTGMELALIIGGYSTAAPVEGIL